MFDLRASPRPVRWLAATSAVVGLQLGAFALAPMLGPSPRMTFLLGFGCVAAAAIAVGASAPAPHVRWALALAVPVVVLATVAAFGPRAGSPALVGLVTAALLIGGTLAGGIVGGRVRRAGYLVVVAYVSSLADLYSVFAPSGVSANVVQSERALAVLALSWPMNAPHGVAAVPLLGVGDVVMTALYLTASRRLGLDRRRTAGALAVAYALLAALLVWIGEAMPALPVLGAAVVVVHPQARRVPRDERRTALLGMAAITVIFAALWLVR